MFEQGVFPGECAEVGFRYGTVLAMNRGARRGWAQRCFVVAAVLALAFPIGRGAEKPVKCPGPGHALAIQNVVRGVIGNLRDRRETIIRNHADWRALWKRLALPLNPAPAVPAVDFSKDMVVAVSAGAGGGILETEIVRIERRKGCMLVSVHERRLPAGSSTPQFSSFHPFHIVRIPAVRSPISFEYAAR